MMTQEDKQLLLKDLCSRLPYHPQILISNDNWDGCQFGEFDNNLACHHIEAFLCDRIEIKPYLRPISSMTEEEKKEFKDTFNGFFQYFNHGIISDSRVYDKNEAVYVGELSCSRLIDWLNAHHFDYRRLIPMGLALEAPEDMYKTV